MSERLRNRLFKRSLWALLSIFFAFLMIIFLIVAPIAHDNYFFVDQFFGAERSVPVSVETDNPNDFHYFTSEYSLKDENGNYVINKSNNINNQKLDFEKMRAHSDEIAKKVNHEGIVLLWNDDMGDGSKALPLDRGDKVSNFGLGSVSYVYHGIGSGMVELDDKGKELLDVKRALTKEDVGLQVNEACFTTLSNASNKGFGISNGSTKELDWSGYSAAAKESIADFGDAALFMVSRYYGEGGDQTMDCSGTKDGNRLTLSDNELDVLDHLKTLKDEKKLEKIILLINCAAPMNLKWVKERGVDACLWINWGGRMGVEALADVLVGNAEPTGHTTDTWVYDMMSAPANRNFGNFVYANYPDEAPNANNKYVVYQEGIYVGYRYYETRYEDVVLNQGYAYEPIGNVMNDEEWDYASEVAYPFGYGMGYSTYSYSNFAFEKEVKDGKVNYNVSVDVTNTGLRKGKDAVQFYLQKPYTDYDRENHIEKASVELVGFEKTPEIEAGATITVKSVIPEYEFKSYDAYGAGTYILEAGDYYLSVGQDSHDALNNILAKKGKTVDDGMTGNGDASLAGVINYKQTDTTTYSVGKNNFKIQNRFDVADVNRNKGMEQQIVYLSRDNWRDTYPIGGVTLDFKGAENIKLVKYDKEVPNDPKDEMPVYETVTSPHGKLNLVMLMNVKYDDPAWDHLLNQLSFAEQEKLVSSCANSATNSIAAPGISQMDGPNGMRSSRMALPSEPIVACTFNKELVEELGKVFGTEMMGTNKAGVYGLGSNTHRSAYGGRANEYYSEDGFLAGVIGSAESKGMRSMGVILFTKHFALNDQDTNRGDGVHTWANEQTIREIYLKAFETAIVDGYCNGLMTSYNSFGPVWSGAFKELCTDVLRGEWGFIGITITDACGASNPHMGATAQFTSTRAFANIAGQDAWMGSFPEGSFNKYYEEKNATLCNAVRESAHRILYTQLHSFMMNGVSSDTYFVEITPAWEAALTGLTVTFGVLMGLCLAMGAVSWVLWYLGRKNNKTNLTEVEK